MTTPEQHNKYLAWAHLAYGILSAFRRPAFYARDFSFSTLTKCGLGDLAIRYGYQRFDNTLMFAVLVGLVLLVSAVQGIGDLSVRRLDHRR